MLFVLDKQDLDIDFDILFFSIDRKLQELWELKGKNALNHETRGSLKFTFLPVKLSVPFIDKSFIYQSNLTTFL